MEILPRQWLPAGERLHGAGGRHWRHGLTERIAAWFCRSLPRAKNPFTYRAKMAGSCAAGNNRNLFGSVGRRRTGTGKTAVGGGLRLSRICCRSDFLMHTMREFLKLI